MKMMQSIMGRTPSLPTVTRIRGPVEEVDVNIHLPNQVVKDILTVVKEPLSKTGKLPEPQDLTAFWKTVERALTGLNSMVDLKKINNRGCHNIAPVILGDAVYGFFEGMYFRAWEELK